MELCGFIFLPFLVGWKMLSSISRKIAWEIFVLCVVYQIWIGKYWFDYTSSLYHVMEPDPQKDPAFSGENSFLFTVLDGP